MLIRSQISFRCRLLLLAVSMAAVAALAGYKAKPWNPRAIDTYTAKQTSERITIAAEALVSDAQAAQIFDKNDIVTAGIMPLAIVIFNENDFPVRVESASIELISGDEHLHTIFPREAVSEIFRKGRGAWGVPTSRDSVNPAALSDFEQKFLGRKTVHPHGQEGGFLYIHPRAIKDLRNYVPKTKLYIPEIYREDNGSRMIFFEFDLQAALEKAAVR